MKTPEEAAEVIGREVFTRKLNECRDPYDGSLCGQDRTLEAMEFGMRESFLAGVAWRDENPPWVSVKTRLPEEDDSYLVTMKNGSQDIFYYSAKTKTWMLSFASQTITHWMPLPPGPKEES